MLRGANTGPNYEEKFVAEAVDALGKAGLAPVVMVDCSHGNSSKIAKNQVLVAKDLVLSFFYSYSLSSHLLVSPIIF